MKIIAISDTHTLHGRIKLPPGDVLVHAGDMLNTGKKEEWVLFVKWWNELKYEHKVMVAGNHDWVLQRDKEWALAGLRDTHYLEDNGVTIEGKLFWGSPWQRPFCDWAFNAPDAFRREKFNLVPHDVSVLVTHTPPQGYRDRIWQDNLGDEFLAERSDAVSPPLHICGHIHYGYGVQLREMVKGQGIVANAAICNEGYKPVNSPLVLHI